MHYPGVKGNQEYRDLYATAQLIDLSLEYSHRAGGYPGVCYALREDDRLEIMLARIGAQMAFLGTGDKVMLTSLQASRPPCDSLLVPQWAVDNTRALSKAEFQEQERIKAMARGQGYTPQKTPPQQTNNQQQDGYRKRLRNRKKTQGSGAGGGASSAQGGGTPQKPH